MKEISVIEPVFFSRFKCVGSACPDHCCQGWDITLDKPTVNRYLKSSEAAIRSIATEHIITTKNSYSNWGMIKLGEQGRCVFLDEERLCKVHKSMGGNALSQTCSSYPRIYTNFKYEIRNNLTLSCPEATKKLLLAPDSMMFIEKKHIRPQALDASDINQETRLLNLMCTNIVISSGVNIEEAFYGMALLFLFLDKLEDGSQRYEKLESYYMDIIAAIENGQINNKIADINPDYQLQSALLLRLQGYLATKKNCRSWPTLHHYTNKLIYIQGKGIESESIESSMQRLSASWQEKMVPWLHQHPHMMSNYIRYRMYEDFFPFKGGRSYFANLYLIVAEWFLIKSMLAACTELVGEMQEQDFINIVYSYHSVTKHDKNAEAFFIEQIEKTKNSDDLSLLYLLK